MSPLLKRKHDSGCIDFIETNELIEPKKICIEVVCSTTTTTETKQNGHKEDNKENEQLSLKDTSTSTATTTTTTVAATTGGQVTPVSKTPTAEPLLTPRQERKPVENGHSDKSDNPKVIVEHQPLPSIYDLRQMSCDDSYDDSGLSDDESSEEESSECDDDDDDEDVRPSPIFEPVLRGTANAKPVITPSPPTPKALYNNDRFCHERQHDVSFPGKQQPEDRVRRKRKVVPSARNNEPPRPPPPPSPPSLASHAGHPAQTQHGLPSAHPSIPKPDASRSASPTVLRPQQLPDATEQSLLQKSPIQDAQPVAAQAPHGQAKSRGKLTEISPDLQHAQIH
jgi:hypothetical protein